MHSFLITGYSTKNHPSLKTFSLCNDSLKQVNELDLLNPSFAYTYGNLLFTINEIDDEAHIQMYLLENNQLLLLDTLTLECGGLCYLSYSPKHHTLFGACYQTGHIFSVGVADHQFTGIKSLFLLEPSPKDNISRAHCIHMDSHENYFYAVNIHTDQIYCYTVDDGSLSPNETFPLLQLPSGNGPRHIIFHPTLSIGYIITEYSNKIFVAAQNPSTGSLHIIQEVVTLPSDYTEESYCSNCIISPNQKYLLAANRGHDSITHFEILEDGTLSTLGLYSCGGVWPRHIDCTNDGQFLMVCNQKSNEVVIFDLDKNTSALGNIIKRIPFMVPSFVKELY